MSKRLNTPLIGVVLLSAFLWGNAYAVKGKYGFSPSGDSNVTGCTFDQTPLPIRVTRDHDTTNAVVKFNIFYVKDGERGIRQSDGVFQHMKLMPVMYEKLSEQIDF